MTIDALVLDASVTATWLLPDEHDDASRNAYVRLRRGALEAHAPELWLWECGNIIASSVKTKRVTPADALLTWSVLDAIRSRVDLASFAPAQVRACLVLAVDEGLSIHQGAYLWLALSLKLPLLTLDKQLAAAAASSSVSVLSLSDL